MKYDEHGGRHCTETETAIYGLFGKYRPLSNFHVAAFEFDGLMFMTSEAAYMSCKTNDKNIKMMFADPLLTPSQAKKLGREIVLRPDWEDYKVLAMTRVLTAKFTQNYDLGTLLVETGTKYIEETNDWNDKFWGVNTLGEGSNMLGHVLMYVRELISPS